MNKSLERTLTQILPTADTIPKELIEVANSLINQSRNRISSLNGEEESARETVCAHIACERMKLKLDLPKIEARPPIRPKIYSKLYAHFDSVLSSSGAKSNPATPSKSASRQQHYHLQSASATPSSFSNRTPLKGAAPPSKALSHFIPTPSSRRDKQPADEYLPTIQSMCDALNCPQAVEHVTKGFNSLSSSFKYAPLASHPIMLIAALFMMVSVRMSDMEDSEEEDSTARYRSLRDKVFEVLGDGLKNVKANKFDKFLAEELMHEDVREMAWYQDIPAKDEEGESGEDMDVDDEEPTPRGGGGGGGGGRSLVIVGKEALSAAPPAKRKKNSEAAGIGTMMQDRVDYLSAKRRRNYAEWKANIVKRMAALQAG